MSEKPKTRSKTYWRSLSELENSPEFESFLHREFPEAASEFPQGVSRRRWLQLMGASLALGGLAGCRYQQEKIVPLAVRPENRVPGNPEKFATTIEVAGAPRHLLVTCYDGRPTKVEGNPEHPFSKGATDAFSQASVLDLYDPDRSGDVIQREGGAKFTRTWDEFEAFWSSHAKSLTDAKGVGLAVLIEPTESVTIRSLLAKLAEKLPEAGVYVYSPVDRSSEQSGCFAAFGKLCRPQLRLDQAKVIVSLDADLFTQHPAATRLIRDFTSGRRPDDGQMNRMYVVESRYTVTGAAADHRLPLRSSQIGRFLGDLESLVRHGLEPGDHAGHDHGSLSGEKRDKVLHAMAEDLLAHRGECVVAVGPHLPEEVQARVHRLNSLLENTGKTVLYTEAPSPLGGTLAELMEQVDSGKVDTLLVLGVNPVYTSPGNVDFQAALQQVKHSIHLSLYDDETSQQCDWHLPQAHPFEAWGDARACDGALCVTQPLIEPLLGGRSVLEMLSLVIGEQAEPLGVVRGAIQQAAGRALNETAWRLLLQDGFLKNSGLPALDVSPAAEEIEAGPSLAEGLELVFYPSEQTYDGSFANNGWLQETPGFLTKLTWDNAAILSPATAKEVGVEHGTLVTLEAAGHTLTVPAFVLPGQAAGSIALALGYGRTESGVVGGKLSDGVPSVGVNANTLRSAAAMWVATGVKLTPTGQAYRLATTQDHHAIDKSGFEETGRRVGEFVREASLDHFKEHPEFVDHVVHELPQESLWKEPSYDGHAWGMSIDLTKCIGCNACSVACQAENNVPIVGKDQVIKGREMHWIRIDRYFHGEDIEDPEAVHQPMMCHHCEMAPCEQVCPVAATVHSDEGLNDMVYNRCIGTRYCANNCPFKVRRFNFLNYNKPLKDPARDLSHLVMNPEVTVRARGVMEKCTYCVQRIQNVKIDAKNNQRLIVDGEIKTACQQACPAGAIEFGDLNRPDARVAQAHANPRSYGMLGVLNIKPRTEYLAKIRNPHPDLAEPEDHSHESSDSHVSHT